jgi:hypothetical protein
LINEPSSFLRRAPVGLTLTLPQLMNQPAGCVRDLRAWLPDQWKRHQAARPGSLSK